MLRISLTAGGFALCLAAPAFAQVGMYGPSDSTANMTCDQIMEKVKSLSISAPGATMALKRKEMIAARAAKARNDEAGCKMHATKALQILTYRT